MKHRKLIKNKQAVSFIGAVILLITVMISVIISSIVFFEFSSATESINRITDDFTITIDVSDEVYFNLSRTPDTSIPDLDVYYLDNGTWTQMSTANFNRTGTSMHLHFESGSESTQARVIFNARGAGSVNTVVTYAITVFALLAIVPLIMVGGLMLRSLGFMGAGEVI